MKKALKWAIILVGSLAVLLLIAAVAVFLLSEGRLNRIFDIERPEAAYLLDDPDLEQGAHLAAIRGCLDCHGGDLGGGPVVDDPALGKIYASNLTRGQGGIGDAYSDAELAFAIRHGIDREGKGLLVMPSQEFFILSDADTRDLVGYIRSVDPVDRAIPAPNITLLGRAFFMAGQLPPMAAEILDHTAQRPAPPEAAVDAEYGAYLATSCMGCHGSDFAGGPVPGRPPDFPPAANLTPSGNLADWEEADFIRALRTGATPDGRVLDPAVMPWPMTAQMTDLELGAIWVYLQSIPSAQVVSE